LHALLSDPRTELETIEVIDDRGVVTLKGTVGDPEVRHAAEEIAAGQSGVLSVTNALEVVPDDDTPTLRARLLGWGLLSYKGGLGNPPTTQP
jgi:hypothetical protein